MARVQGSELMPPVPPWHRAVLAGYSPPGSWQHLDVSQPGKFPRSEAVNSVPLARSVLTTPLTPLIKRTNKDLLS